MDGMVNGQLSARSDVVKLGISYRCAVKIKKLRGYETQHQRCDLHAIVTREKLRALTCRSKLFLIT
jgi:hypothetical protein